ncbi:methyltransferase family protein [Thermosporothrix hazakensis]|jgi:SAM-dependent methyltransferase|uniref:Methyltransferase family protein n=1 Tax=Thermosporothrix hazakensis TaxID=644383 RepID=A0A326UJH5_THEHA|nr:class I SAM-dependent methyltransferase [Thermosporothrix hazakensis]PZW36800.1 methyltransferase family protein [Thermosporothrix hazakensis]GCE47449.1 type 12 methyltransferase [Thermosporothrix hazakensis]
MNSYDPIATFYDIEHAHFVEDLDMYHNYAELGGGSILELACGSGRVLLPLAEDGYEVTGVDTSAQMLERAQQALAEAGVAQRVTLVQQDISQLTLGKKFHLAFIALGSFAHITTRAKQQQTLAAIRAHLNPGGTFLLDLSNSDIRYMENMGGQLIHQGTWKLEDGSMLTHFVSPAASTDRHLLELTHFYDCYTQGGPIQRTTTTTYHYLFERSEIELLLEQAGFTIKEILGDYDFSPFRLDSPRLICVATTR